MNTVHLNYEILRSIDWAMSGPGGVRNLDMEAVWDAPQRNSQSARQSVKTIESLPEFPRKVILTARLPFQ